jgi:hypothetical protein
MVDAKRVFAPQAVNELFTGWLIHSHKARDRHDDASRKYAKYQFALGIPSLVVSTVVGTSVFAALSLKEVTPLWVGFLSIVAAVLAALQTFMDFGGRSDKHRNAAVKYKSSIRLLEETIVQLHQGKELTQEDIGAIRMLIDGLEETAPVIMPKIYDSIEKKYQDLKYVSDAIGLYSKALP